LEKKKKNDSRLDVNYNRRMGYIQRGLMAARITKRHVVALPRRFGAPIRQLAG
jgi:hypothetical protein